MSAEPQMVRSHTSWVVARMAHAHSVRNRALGKQVGRSVGPRAANSGIKTQSKVPVAITITTPTPQPAISRFVDLAPKTYGGWPSLVCPVVAFANGIPRPFFRAPSNRQSAPAFAQWFHKQILDHTTGLTLVLGRRQGASIGWSQDWPTRTLLTDLGTAQLWRVTR